MKPPEVHVSLHSAYTPTLKNFGGLPLDPDSAVPDAEKKIKRCPDFKIVKIPKFLITIRKLLAPAGRQDWLSVTIRGWRRQGRNLAGAIVGVACGLSTPELCVECRGRLWCMLECFR